MTTIEPVHFIAYEHGADPIEHAAWHIAMHFEISEQVVLGQVHPGVAVAQLDHDLTSVARRAVAALLDAGWTPPDVTNLQIGEAR